MPTLRALLVDLDETLYPPNCGMLPAADRSIAEFIARRLDIPFDEADALRHRLWMEYGTTARGLAVEHGIPAEEMCAEALENMDMSPYLRPDRDLAEQLRGLDVRRVLFTNAPRGYAEKALEALGLTGVFEAVLDLRFLAWEGKPSPSAFERALEFLQVEPGEVALVDDNPPNLRAARDAGMLAVAVGREAADEADIALDRIQDLVLELRRRGLV